MERIVVLEKTDGFLTEFRKVFENKINPERKDKTIKFLKECKAQNKRPSEVMMNMFVSLR